MTTVCRIVLLACALFVPAIRLAAQEAESSNAVANAILDAADALDFVFRPSDGFDAATIEGCITAPRPDVWERVLIAEDRFKSGIFGASELAIDSFQPQDVIDNDWKRVKNPKAAPFKGIVLCVAEFRLDGTAIYYQRGTAYFVSDTVLLTSAHVLHNRLYQEVASSVKIIGPDGRSYTAKKHGILKGYPKTLSVADDIGWIALQESNKPNLGGFQFVPKILDDGLLKNVTLVSAGFPADRTGMWQDRETDDQFVLKRYFLHYHDTEAGCSGMPLWYTASKVRYAVGVHHGIGSSGISNKATRFTTQNMKVVDRVRDKF